MEIKCDICGTINDGETNFCKGCFQKLNVERTLVKKTEEQLIIEVPIVEEKQEDIPWNVEGEVSNIEPVFDEIEENQVEENVSNDQEVEVLDDWDAEKVKDTEEINIESVSNIMEPIKELSEINSIAPIKPEENYVNEEEVSNINSVVDEIDENVTIEEKPINKLEEIEILDDWNIEKVEEPKESNNNEEVAIIEPISELSEINSITPIESEENNLNEEEISNINSVFDEIEENATIEEKPTNKLEEIEILDDWNIEKVEEPKESDNTEEVAIIEPISELSETSLQVALEEIDNWDELKEKSELISTDNWNIEEEPVIESIKEPNFVLRFLIRYLILVIVLFGITITISKIMPNLFTNDNGVIIEFIIYRLLALIILLISTKMTFLKEVPKNVNKPTFKILGFIAIPGILIQLFILGFIKETKVLMFVIAIILAVITLAIFLNYMRNIIRKKSNYNEEDKEFFIYGISSIVVIVLLLVFGMFIRVKNLDMPKVNLFYSLFQNVEKDKELISNFVFEVKNNILKNQTENTDYIFPDKVTDVRFATYNNKTPDEINLIVNENGGIEKGTITYRGIIYTYEGGNIKTF